MTANLHQDRENLIRKTASEIYSAISGEVPSFFDSKRWIGRISEWAMKDETFKSRLFRYISLLPSLKTDEQVAEALTEHLVEETNSPLFVKRLIGLLGKSAPGSYFAAKTVRLTVESLARQFIAGKNPEDALKTLEEIHEQGFALSVDLLGEVVSSETEAAQYRERYLHLLDFMREEASGWEEDPLIDSDDRGTIPRFDISVKASSLCAGLDPADREGSAKRAKEDLGPLFTKAEETGASLCLDMEHYYLKDIIISIFQSVLDEFPDYPFAGVALQAYLKETRTDLLKLIEWARKRKNRITIRLVKGAYWDYENAASQKSGQPAPVFQKKEETDRNFEELSAILLENREYVRPAIATHNLRSISNAIAAADSLHLSRGAFEFQMLYGIGEPLRRVLRNRGYRVRVYMPVGEFIPGMAYLVRRLLENTSNESFVRQMFGEKRPFEELIRPPGTGSS